MDITITENGVTLTLAMPDAATHFDVISSDRCYGCLGGEPGYHIAGCTGTKASVRVARRAMANQQLADAIAETIPRP